MTKKVNLEVFVPLHKCSCHYSFFIQKIEKAIQQYRNSVTVEVKGITSPEGIKYEINDLALVVNKETKLHTDFKEEELLEIIQNKLR